ncbi:DNA alkylation repair protein [Clostridium akagii]|uniref:DNA alkylation repair protein n=1 Tax=Clostridium akagii TaxID=91623 RepID=UPI00068FF646|nr:DNA alkylation repair protein [Clostridium akagii]
MNYEELTKILLENSDEKYKKFNSRIIPDTGKSYGVRLPILKDIAKKIALDEDTALLRNKLNSSDVYEDKLLEGFITAYSEYEDTRQMLWYINRHINRMNNWSLCDCFVTSLKKLVLANIDVFYKLANKCVKSKKPWVVRFGLIIYVEYFNEQKYLEEMLADIENISIDHYYVKMGEAWLLSSLYIVNKERVVEFINVTAIDKWTINKACQKIIESTRVSAEDKVFVKSLKRK